jgi:aconitate hydratase
LTFKEPIDYDVFKKGAKVVLPDVRRRVEEGRKEIPVHVEGRTVITLLDVSARQRKYLLAGGALNHVRDQLKKNGS